MDRKAAPVPFAVIHQLTELQIKDLHALFQGEWWTTGRQLDEVRRMLEHTDVIVAFCEPQTQKLVAFSRVLTDRVYKALILDVIVDRAYRGRGLGRALLDLILQHPSLTAVRHFELYCRPELVPFYRHWGFTDDLGALRFMRRTEG